MSTTTFAITMNTGRRSFRGYVLLTGCCSLIRVNCMDSEGEAQVWVRIDGAGADAEILQMLADELRAELLVLDVDGVTQVVGDEHAPGARGLEWASIGILLVSIKNTTELIGQLVATVRTWLGRRSRPRAVEMTVGDRTLRLTDASDDQQDRLIDEFIHAIAQQ